MEHLLRRYGSLIDEILDLTSEQPELAEPLPGAEDYLKAEVVYAAAAEGALHLDDVLARRLASPSRPSTAASARPSPPRA